MKISWTLEHVNIKSTYEMISYHHKKSCITQSLKVFKCIVPDDLSGYMVTTPPANFLVTLFEDK